MSLKEMINGKASKYLGGGIIGVVCLFLVLNFITTFIQGQEKEKLIREQTASLANIQMILLKQTEILQKMSDYLLRAEERQSTHFKESTDFYRSYK
jgi:hypothetical protein